MTLAVFSLRTPCPQACPKVFFFSQGLSLKELLLVSLEKDQPIAAHEVWD